MSYILWILLPLSAPMGALVGGGLCWLTVGLFFIVIPLLDHFTGTEVNLSHRDGVELFEYRFFGPFSAMFYYLFLWVCFRTSYAAGLGVIEWLGVYVSSSLISGFLVASVIHEFLHKKDRFSKFVSWLMLIPILRAELVVEHVDGHHHDGATSRDPATARYKETIYHFIPRAIKRSYRSAWKYEYYRLLKQNYLVYGPRNRNIQGLLGSLCIFIAVNSLVGWQGAVFLIFHGLFASVWIESLNYVQHYGLRRAANEYKRNEEFGIQHAWDSDHIISNQLLLHSGRHTSHHLQPEISYRKLKSGLGSPKLPFGYFTMILVAFIPPLWSYLVHPLAQRVRRNIPMDD